MHRLFAGLPVPEPLVERLRLLQTDLPGARWRRDDQLHVTLQFYGEVHQEVAEEIADQLGRVARPAVPLALPRNNEPSLNGPDKPHYHPSHPNVAMTTHRRRL